MNILNLIRDGEIITIIARRYDVNESTIRNIRYNEQSIREYVQSRADGSAEINVRGVVQNVLQVAREIEGESFTDMQETEILDILLPSVRTYFNPEELEEMANHVPENVQEEMVPSFNAKSISRIINHIQDAVKEAMNLDPIMARSLLIRQRC